MFQFKQSEATADRRRIFFYAVDATDGYTAVTASITSGVVLIVKNGNTPGTTPVSPTFTHISNGLWYYEMTASHLDTQGVVSVTITGSNIRTVQLIGYVYSGDPMAAIPTFPTNFSSLAITGTGAVTAGTVSDKTGYSLSVAPPTAAQIWATDVSGYTTAGQAGTYQNKLDAAITTRMASFTYTAPLTSPQTASAVWDALLASYTVNNSFGQRVLRSTTSQSTCAVTGSNHIAADIHQLQADVITAAGIATGAIDANALAADAATEIATATWNLDISGVSLSGQAGRYITDIKVDTTNIASSVSTIEGTAYRESVADILLGRNLAGGSNTGRLVKEALYALRNKSEIVGSTLNVYNATDGAIAWTAAVASSGSAVPVTGVDPT